jgi:xanthine dehydrogenase accessory factor
VGDLGGSAELTRRAAWEGRGALARGGTRLVHDCADHTLFVEAFVPPPRMVVFGAIDFSAALVRVAQVLGFRVTVCDARPVFATRLRFPTADEVVVDWPDRLLARIGPALGPRDAVCVLTHDAKFDVPAVLAALATDVGYIGALGSRRTHAERLLRLEEAGVDGDALVRLRSPIGLDLGARTPEETAVAICAEIIADQTGSRPAPLSETDGPIHRRPFAGGRAESGADAETGRSTGTAVGGA